MTTPRPRAVSRFVLVAVATPVVAAAVGVLLQLATAAALRIRSPSTGARRGCPTGSARRG
jgi:hypothetical protein